jgi:hypothetical protein
MRHIIFILTISLFVMSCGQTDTKQKELELKEKELALKEKELSLKYNDSTHPQTVKLDTTKQIANTEIKQREDLPFIGKRIYNMDGGSGTANIITITKDGLVTIQGVPSNEAANEGAKGDIEFKGSYQPIIKTKSGSRYKIESDKISLVNAKGQIERGCGSGGIEANEPCTATLDKF